VDIPYFISRLKKYRKFRLVNLKPRNKNTTLAGLSKCTLSKDVLDYKVEFRMPGAELGFYIDSIKTIDEEVWGFLVSTKVGDFYIMTN